MAKGIPAWMQALGQGVLQAVVNSPQAQAVQDGTPRRIRDQIGQWMGHLGQNAMLVWAPALVRNELCSFCDEDAISKCVACGDFVCLGHSFASHRAELLCDECVSNVLPEGRVPETAEQRAFKFFNLSEQATLEEVKAVYRVRVQKAHPDRGGDDRLFNETTAALRVLEEHFLRKAA